jgi:hypothetical protein
LGIAAKPLSLVGVETRIIDRNSGVFQALKNFFTVT